MLQDESAEGGKAPGDLLYPLYVLDWAHARDGRNLVRVGLDAALGDDEAEQHAPRDPENAFLGVELDIVCSEFRKDLLKISNEVVSPLGLHHDVVDVGLNGSPDEVSEASEHTSPNGIET